MTLHKVENMKSWNAASVIIGTVAGEEELAENESSPSSSASAVSSCFCPADALYTSSKLEESNVDNNKNLAEQLRLALARAQAAEETVMLYQSCIRSFTQQIVLDHRKDEEEKEQKQQHHLEGDLLSLHNAIHMLQTHAALAAREAETAVQDAASEQAKADRLELQCTASQQTVRDLVERNHRLELRLEKVVRERKVLKEAVVHLTREQHARRTTQVEEYVVHALHSHECVLKQQKQNRSRTSTRDDDVEDNNSNNLLESFEDVTAVTPTSGAADTARPGTTTRSANNQAAAALNPEKKRVNAFLGFGQHCVKHFEGLTKSSSKTEPSTAGPPSLSTSRSDSVIRRQEPESPKPTTTYYEPIRLTQSSGSSSASESSSTTARGTTEQAGGAAVIDGVVLQQAPHPNGDDPVLCGAMPCRDGSEPAVVLDYSSMDDSGCAPASPPQSCGSSSDSNNNNRIVLELCCDDPHVLRSLSIPIVSVERHPQSSVL
jgi:hypothetical protein